MTELRELVRELADEHGASRLGVPWRAVLAACDDPRDASACQRVSPDEDTPVDSVLRDVEAGARFDALARSDRARVEDAVWRALERAAPGFAPPELSPSTMPPADWADLAGWVESNGLAPLLSKNLEETAGHFVRRSLTAQAGVDPSAMSLGDLLQGASRAARDFRDPTLRDGVRDYLAYALGRHEALTRRRASWSVPPIGDGMVALADALAGLRESVLVDEPPPPVDVADARLHVDPGAAELVATVRTVWNTSEEIALSVFGREAGLPTLRWSQYAPPEREAWTRALAEWWSDAVHDPDHPLHTAVREVADRAAWPRFLEELSRSMEVPDETAKEPERVIWRVAREAGSLAIEPVVQRRGKRGWTKGRRVERDAIEGSDADPLDERVARGLARSLADGVRALVGHPRVVLAEDPKRGVHVEEAAIEIELDETERTVKVWVGESRLDPVELLSRMATPTVYTHLNGDEARLATAVLPDAVRVFLEASARWRPRLPPEADEGLMELLSRLPATVGLRLPPELAGRSVEPERVPRLALVLHDAGDLEVRLRVSPLRDQRRFSPGVGPVHLSGRASGERCHTTRDLHQEVREAELWTERLGLTEARELESHRFLLTSAERALDLLARAGEHEELILEWPEGKGRLRLVGTVSSLKVTARQAGDWLVLDAGVEVDEARVSLAQLRRAVERGERFVRLRKGDYIRLTDELKSRIDGLGDVSSVEDGEVVVRPEAVLAVDRILGEDLKRGAFWMGLTDKIRAAHESTPGVPEELNAELRDYQSEGVTWLLRLGQWSSGACLADEMGLGKTVQALALLLARRHDGPALVVAPTSLAYNWQAEAAKFAPALDVRIYRGTDRVSALKDVGPGTLLVTSYDLMARDIERLAPIRFGTVVFDEAHALKNPKTFRARAAVRLDTGFHLALTGTPLENHLGELWSLFSILVP
ncbi:MAG: DEAD/DEAH box helicase, partial [Sandaracinaceae bacterium]